MMPRVENHARLFGVAVDPLQQIFLRDEGIAFPCYHAVAQLVVRVAGIFGHLCSWHGVEDIVMLKACDVRSIYKVCNLRQGRRG